MIDAKMSATQFVNICILLSGSPDASCKEQARYLIERFAREHAEQVARRRAIEELKALAKDMCVHCAAGVEFVRLSDNLGQWSGHAHSPSDLWDCDALALHDRIAAIEAEEA